MSQTTNNANWNDDIATAVETMRRGGIILYPTDTIWGIGCDARNPEAVKKIYDIKQRADSKALICLVGSMAMLEATVEEIPDAAEQIIDVAVAPTTIVYDHGRNVAPNLLADDGSLGVRITSEPFSAALCRAMRGPVVSTSANISGQPSPACFAEISEEIKQAVDYICLARRDEASSGKSSCVIKISTGNIIKILRK